MENQEYIPRPIMSGKMTASGSEIVDEKEKKRGKRGLKSRVKPLAIGASTTILDEEGNPIRVNQTIAHQSGGPPIKSTSVTSTK